MEQCKPQVKFNGPIGIDVYEFQCDVCFEVFYYYELKEDAEGWRYCDECLQKRND